MMKAKNGIILKFLFISVMLFSLPLLASTSASSLHDQSTNELPLEMMAL